MTDLSFERSTRQWLDAGPTAAPAEAVAAVLEAIERVPQDRPHVRVMGRPIPASRRALLATAASIAVAAAVTGAVLLRPPGPNVATPRDSGHLLFDYPETRTVLERNGGPTDADERVELGTLSGSKAFVVGAACDGGRPMVVEAYAAGVTLGEPIEGEPPPTLEPDRSLTVPCDGRAAHVNVGAGHGALPATEYDLVLVVAAGTTWRVAAGAYVDFDVAPAFPAIETTEGWYPLLDSDAMLVTGHPGPGIGVQVPERATTIGIFVQCSGSAVTVTSEVGPPMVVPCDDSSITHRIELPAEGLAFSVLAGSDRISWVRLASEADGEIGGERPSAPALPAGVADTAYADGDGQFAAFGTLGSSDQTLVQLPGSRVGIAAGDHVAIAVRDGDRGRLELWSISRGERLATLAELPSADGVFRSWVDNTHRQVIYGYLAADYSAEFHRVSFDGTGDHVIAETPAIVVLAQSELAVDDSTFIVDWCVPLACSRAIHDMTTGTTTEVALVDRTCHLLGIADGQVVASVGESCDDGLGDAVTVSALDASSRRELLDRGASGTVVATTTGPLVVVQQLEAPGTTLSAVPLAGGDVRELARFEDAASSTHTLSSVRLPGSDWILLAGPLADTPTNQSTGRNVPILLNVLSGEQIELANLPHSTE
jgi:hypothetical protein